MALNAQQRTLRARGAAYAMHAKGGTNTTPARAAFIDKFRSQVDPEGLLEVEERDRRAQAALRSHMTMLALRSSKSRTA